MKEKIQKEFDKILQKMSLEEVIERKLLVSSVMLRGRSIHLSLLENIPKLILSSIKSFIGHLSEDQRNVFARRILSIQDQDQLTQLMKEHDDEQERCEQINGRDYDK